MKLLPFALLAAAGAVLAGCGQAQTPAQKAEAIRNEAIRNQAAQMEADLDRVRSDLRNMAEVQNRMRNIADEALEEVEARRRAEDPGADPEAPAQ